MKDNTVTARWDGATSEQASADRVTMVAGVFFSFTNTCVARAAAI